MNQTERNEPYIKSLLDFIDREYHLRSVSITPAKRGFYGETWRLDTAFQTYFLKLDYSAVHQSIYENSFPIVEHLCNHGIDFISRIVKTADGRLSTRYDRAVLGVFDWIDGINIETDDTKIPEYQMLAKVYTVSPCEILIPREDFSGKSADKFFSLWDATDDARITSLLDKNRGKLEYRAERLKHFAGLCQSDATGFFITHGDAGGNLIVNGDRHYIVDWDAPILAPPERDAWVMCFRDWARCLFQKELHRNGIYYTLRSERLAYYCYHTFFFYLTEYLSEYLAGFKQDEITRQIGGYFDTWVEERIEYADRML